MPFGLLVIIKFRKNGGGGEGLGCQDVTHLHLYCTIKTIKKGGHGAGARVGALMVPRFLLYNLKTKKIGGTNGRHGLGHAEMIHLHLYCTIKKQGRGLGLCGFRNVTTTFVSYN